MKQMMQQSNSRAMRLLAGACSLLLILTAAPTGVAQQAVPSQPLPNQRVASAPTAAAPATVSAAASAVAASPAAKPAGEEETATPATPGQEGIKIHGHWVLQVKNPDGSLGQKREFDNSLVPGGTNTGGDQVLAALISGNMSTGDPAIVFYTTIPSGTYDASSLCINNREAPSSNCYLFNTTQNQPFLSTAYASTQTGLSTALSLQPNVNWVLSGNYTVPSGLTTIALVQTILLGCVNSTAFTNTYPLTGNPTSRTSDLAAKSCIVGAAGLVTGSGDYPLLAAFTSTVVPGGPLTVTTGQVISVTVTISFS